MYEMDLIGHTDTVNELLARKIYAMIFVRYFSWGGENEYGMSINSAFCEPEI